MAGESRTDYMLWSSGLMLLCLCVCLARCGSILSLIIIIIIIVIIIIIICSHSNLELTDDGGELCSMNEGSAICKMAHVQRGKAAKRSRSSSRSRSRSKGRRRRMQAACINVIMPSLVHGAAWYLQSPASLAPVYCRRSYQYESWRSKLATTTSLHMMMLLIYSNYNYTNQTTQPALAAVI